MKRPFCQFGDSVNALNASRTNAWPRADVGERVVVALLGAEELRVEERDRRQRPRRAVGEVVRRRVQERAPCAVPQSARNGRSQ